MAFTTHLKALSSKAEAKLQKVKAKYRLHKTKAAEKAKATGKVNTAGETNAVDNMIMAEENVSKAAVHTNAADDTNVEINAKVDSITMAESEANVQLAVDPEANDTIIMVEAAVNAKATDNISNAAVKTKSKVHPITEVESKTEVDHKTKCQPEIKVQAETSVQPMPTNHEEQGNTSEPSQSGEEEKPNPAASSNACKKLQKLARRAGRRQARKAKWASWRAAFKVRAHRFGDAAFLPVAIIGGVIFGPVLIAWDLAMCVVSVAGWIVVKVIDLTCAPFVACYYICRELDW